MQISWLNLILISRQPSLPNIFLEIHSSNIKYFKGRKAETITCKAKYMLNGFLFMHRFWNILLTFCLTKK